MDRILRARLLAAALLVPAGLAASAFVPQPALAQSDDEEAGSSVSFRSFYDRLAPYGRWFESDRWGYVWHPEAVGPDFRPYFDGHWVNTERYGWFWVSDEEFGDIVYHYGRWVYDPDDGWLWVPGYVWGPAWVIWREGEGSTGWFPMPPDEEFYAGDDSYRDDWSDYASDYYGYNDWYGPAFAATFFSLWIFVDDDHFGDRHFHRYVRRHHRDRDDENFFRRTRDATRYTTAEGFVVNRGVDPRKLRQRTGQPFAPVRLRDVLPRSAPAPTPIDLGRQVRKRELQSRPDLMPRWFRRGEPFKGLQGPQQTGPRQTGPQRPGPNYPERFQGPAVQPATPVPPGGPAVSPWRKRQEGGPPPGVAPDGNMPPSNVFMPRQPPAPPVVKQPQAPQAPAFERRFGPRPPLDATPPAGPVEPPPARFERFRPPPNNPPANTPPPAAPPAERFQGFHPPPAITHTPPPPPPPAVTRTPPPAPKPPADEEKPRDRRWGSPQH